MAVGISAAPAVLTISASLSAAGRHISGRVLLLSPLSGRRVGARTLRSRRKRGDATVFFVVDESGKSAGGDDAAVREVDGADKKKLEQIRISESRVTERRERKRSERTTYLIAAVMSSLGITSMAVAAVYYRFAWQMEVNFSFSPLYFKKL